MRALGEDARASGSVRSGGVRRPGVPVRHHHHAFKCLSRLERGWDNIIDVIENCESPEADTVERDARHILNLGWSAMFPLGDVPLRGIDHEQRQGRPKQEGPANLIR